MPPETALDDNDTAPEIPVVRPPVFLRHLSSDFVQFLDDLIGNVKAANGGYAAYGFEVRAGQPGIISEQRTYKSKDWTPILQA